MDRRTDEQVVRQTEWRLAIAC